MRVFFCSTNFNKRFIKNYRIITVPLTSMLKAIITNSLEAKKYIGGIIGIDRTSTAGGKEVIGKDKVFDWDIKNLSTIAKTKDLAKSKKSVKTLDFAKVKFFGTDFLSFKAKKAFIYLQGT